MQEQLKKLFTSMLILSGDSYFIDEDKLRQHARIVMEGLGAAVESLEDSIYLTNLLIAMGERHYGYRVKADMLVVRFVKSIFVIIPHLPTHSHGRAPSRV